MLMNPPNKRTVAVLGGATALLLLGGVGGAVAAGQISGKQIKDHTITAKDLKKSSVQERRDQGRQRQGAGPRRGRARRHHRSDGATGATAVGRLAPRAPPATRARPAHRRQG